MRRQLQLRGDLDLELIRFPGLAAFWASAGIDSVRDTPSERVAETPSSLTCPLRVGAGHGPWIGPVARESGAAGRCSAGLSERQAGLQVGQGGVDSLEHVVAARVRAGHRGTMMTPMMALATFR